MAGGWNGLAVPAACPGQCLLTRLVLNWRPVGGIVGYMTDPKVLAGLGQSQSRWVDHGPVTPLW